MAISAKRRGHTSERAIDPAPLCNTYHDPLLSTTPIFLGASLSILFLINEAQAEELLNDRRQFHTLAAILFIYFFTFCLGFPSIHNPSFCPTFKLRTIIVLVIISTQFLPFSFFFFLLFEQI